MIKDLKEALPPTPTPTIGMGEVKALLSTTRTRVKTLRSGNAVDWVKWDVPGKVVEGTFVRLEQDVRGQFNVHDVLHLRGADGRAICIRCPTALQRTLRENQGAFQANATVLRIVYTGPVQTKDGLRVMKGFEVGEVVPDVDGQFKEMLDGKEGA